MLHIATRGADVGLDIGGLSPSEKRKMAAGLRRQLANMECLHRGGLLSPDFYRRACAKAASLLAACGEPMDRAEQPIAKRRPSKPRTSSNDSVEVLAFKQLARSSPSGNVRVAARQWLVQRGLELV